MRTTLTLDDDLARALKAEARRTGKPLKQVVNESLRKALGKERPPKPPRRFKVEARPMGLRPGIDLTSISALLDELDGPARKF